MMKAAIVVCGLLISSAASAADWVEIGSGGGATAFVDNDSIREDNAYLRAWTMWNFSEPDMLFGKEFVSRKNLMLVDCSARTTATLRAIFYPEANGGGASIYSDQVSPDELMHREPAPETIGESILEYVCTRRAAKA